MSVLAAAVRMLSAEIAEAEDAARCATDGSTDTVDALENVAAALGNLIEVARMVVSSWETG